MPISINPKPSKAKTSKCSAFLSNPAPRPTGLGKSIPKTLFWDVVDAGIYRL